MFPGVAAGLVIPELRGGCGQGLESAETAVCSVVGSPSSVTMVTVAESPTVYVATGGPVVPARRSAHTSAGKRRPFPFPFQRIAHGGTCGKTRIPAQYHRS